MRKRVVAVSVAVGSLGMLALAWLGIVAADDPATYGTMPSTEATADAATSADNGLVRPGDQATPVPTPVRQSRAS